MTKREASEKIAAILAQLEIATGQRVTEIGLWRTEETSIDDDHTRHVVAVHIALERPIGQRWSIGKEFTK